ncbi:rhamnan synthesis F family protein [Microbulbifer agarilyticus]|uniref:rhamnan synthesis F family protein n=1 Tax=Microbulbifer agarilyticus TaxID=260552 RepID=UPI001CD2AE21|nr:rhamnan synthesis F family protein [Microbulbifer agarilyticus]MCA0901411.1 glycosyltransferase [Microbulbifer agarilyticus]
MSVLNNLNFPRFRRDRACVDYVWFSENFSVIAGWISFPGVAHIGDIHLEFSDGDVNYQSQSITFPRADVERVFRGRFPSVSGFVACVSGISEISDAGRNIIIRSGEHAVRVTLESKKVIHRIETIHEMLELQSDLLVSMMGKFAQLEGAPKPPSEPIDFTPEGGADSKRDLVGLSDNQVAEYEALSELNIDLSTLRVSGLDSPGSDLLKEIVRNWRDCRIEFSGFDSEFYLECYPDIRAAGINPLLHYVLHGAQEGRIGSLPDDFSSFSNAGQVPYDPRKPNIAIATHESSATGAPLVSLNLAQVFSRNFNIFSIVIREAEIHGSFVESCSKMMSSLDLLPEEAVRQMLGRFFNGFKIDSLICNSVETFSVLKAASELGVPTVSLIHEFSEYTKPAGKIGRSIAFADSVVFPSRLLYQSAKRDLALLNGFDQEPNNVVIQPQGVLPVLPEGHGDALSVNELKLKLQCTDKTRVVVGAGFVQSRKGVDLFVHTAAMLDEVYGGDYRFVWVGDGYKPEADLQVSVWIKKQIEVNGLSDKVVFLGHQRNLDNVLELADAFFLSSRLDPFPNVVLDALQADLPIVCFENATGCAEFLVEHHADSYVVRYLDVKRAAEAIVDIFIRPDASRKTGRNRKLAADSLSFDGYCNRLLELVANAKRSVSEAKEVTQAIAERGLFDASFFKAPERVVDPLYYYVKTSQNGLKLGNPCPGFNTLEWLSQKHASVSGVPLYDHSVHSNNVGTHSVVLISGVGGVPEVKKIAVHLHLFYPDLAAQFSEYFSCLPDGYHLYVTYTDKIEENFIQRTFSNCGAGLVVLRLVENVGRDVTPFFSELSDELYLGGYDVVGHFHSKKSLSTSDKVGDRWRNYLLRNLIGSKEAATEILSCFNQSGVGLVFAEDMHAVDIGRNDEYARELCEAAGIEPPENVFIFPLGTMFWARPEALKPLWELRWEDFTPDEPLPYDGSHLHAVERLLPHVARSQNFKYTTVYARGTDW